MIIGGPLKKDWWFAKFDDYDWENCTQARCVLYGKKSERVEENDLCISTVRLEHVVPIDRLDTEIYPATKTMYVGNFCLMMEDFEWC